MSIAQPHHRFSIPDYVQMIDLGILTPRDRVELIHGEIIEKMSIGQMHAACVMLLTGLFHRRLSQRAIVSVQNPLRLQDSLPEPDLIIVKPRDDFYAASYPTPQDVLLLVEVADTSLDFDRNVKGPLYAENGIAEYWILNLLDRTLEVYRQPQPDGRYAHTQLLTKDDAVTPEHRSDATFAVADFFPRA